MTMQDNDRNIIYSVSTCIQNDIILLSPGFDSPINYGFNRTHTKD